MATQPEISDALDEFARRFAAEPRLKQMTAGWDRTIEVRATDLGTVERFAVSGGRLTRIGPDEGPRVAPIVMEARGDLLRDVFLGRTPPTEPYMTGDLILRASEEDVMRIDVIALMIWGE